MGWVESGQCKTGITFMIQPVVRIITKPGTDTTGEAIKKHRLEKVTHLREIDVSICYTFSIISHGCYGRVERLAVLLETHAHIAVCLQCSYTEAT